MTTRESIGLGVTPEAALVLVLLDAVGEGEADVVPDGRVVAKLNVPPCDEEVDDCETLESCKFAESGLCMLLGELEVCGWTGELDICVCGEEFEIPDKPSPAPSGLSVAPADV